MRTKVRFSLTGRCITCWDQTLLSRYDAPKRFLLRNLHTDNGKTRIDGVGSMRCPSSVDVAILGVASKQATYLCATGIGFDQAGRTLVRA